MKENNRCSTLFHLLVPGGKWQTVSLRPTFERWIPRPLRPVSSRIRRALLVWTTQRSARRRVIHCIGSKGDSSDATCDHGRRPGSLHVLRGFGADGGEFAVIRSGVG